MGQLLVGRAIQIRPIAVTPIFRNQARTPMLDYLTHGNTDFYNYLDLGCLSISHGVSEECRDGLRESIWRFGNSTFFAYFQQSRYLGEHQNARGRKKVKPASGLFGQRASPRGGFSLRDSRRQHRMAIAADVYADSWKILVTPR